MKNTRLAIILSTLVILLPMALGLIFWNQLPEKLPTHWGIDGEVDGWSSRSFAVLAFPLYLAAIHWLCLFLSMREFKKKRHSPRILGVLLWICPAISILFGSLIYGFAMGREINILFVMPLFFGLLFVLLGNYLPKCQQNRTIGIRIKWTLENEANWNATHRFAGKLWVAGGLAAIGSAFLPSRSFILILVLIAILTLVPVAYSCWFHKRKE